MSLRFILGLGIGDLHKGFPDITGEFQENQTTVHKFKGSLPPAPEVDDLQKRWQLICRAGQSSNILSRIKVKATGTTNISEDNPQLIYQYLNESMRLWLSSEEFYGGIEENFRSVVDAVGGKTQCFEVFLEIKDSENWHLPWDAWKFREDYKNCEIIKSPSQYRKALKKATAGGMPLPSRGRILCVSGNSDGLDLRQDEKSLQRSFGDRCELEFMQQPTPQQLRDHLSQDEKNWQILYYGGHSDSNAVNGWLQINQANCDNNVTIDYLKEGLEKSIFQGLELLILNSCSSLQLAADLVAGGLPLPSMIVMRAPIPDKIAHDFVKSLFGYLSKEYPLFLAVRKAKDDLQKWESEFPGASAIPVLCQQPTFEGLTLLLKRVKRSYPLGNRPLVAVADVLGDTGGDRPNNDISIFISKLMPRLGIGLATTASSYMLMGPILAPVANQIGMENHRQNKPLIAKIFYKLASLINLNYAQPYYNLAVLCDELNDDRGALEAMQNAVLRGLPDASAQISKLFIRNDKHQPALKAINLCLEHAKYDGVKAACIKNRGWIRFKEQQYDDAAIDFKTAIGLTDKSPEAHCFLAQVLETKGKPHQALYHWKKTIKYSKSSVPEQDKCIQIAKQHLRIKGNIK
ncbi:CHAT domain-containing protein [Microcoleus sp. Pol14C6]|uniref:CHAT domain-containing protein n=1 Tax=unclassified Microcoleus TaxID=2642155 RepID=UPI002FCEFD92